MTQRIKNTDWQNVLITMIIPVIALISTAGVIYAQVGDLKVMMKETSVNVQRMSERLTAVETKVQFLYDERKKD